MRELRLVLSASIMWAVAIVVRLGAPFGAVALIIVISLLLAFNRQRGQLVLSAACGTAMLVITLAREHFTAQGLAALPRQFPARLEAAPIQTAHGGSLLQLKVGTIPEPLTMFTREPVLAQDGTPPAVGSELTISGAVTKTAGESANLAKDTTISGDVISVEPPTGAYGLAAHVKDTFRQAVEASVTESSAGLILAMVMGDKSLQTPEAEQLYKDTGLAHLSAVSGANVAIIVSCALIMCTYFALSPRISCATALISLVVFVIIVGPEPSVLRAGAMGIVGVIAMVNSRTMQPIHALCLAVMAVLAWRSDLATNFGFALSVAATAGIVALFPLLYRVFASWPGMDKVPDLVVRAVAVAVAADVVTLPIIAGMSGEVSLVAVLANALVTFVVPVVTVVGLIAAIVALAPGGVELILLKLIEPCTWWIHHVAECLSSLPWAVVPSHPVTAMLAYGWVIAGIIAVARPRAYDVDHACCTPTHHLGR